jgi:hypothetical protein
MRSIRISWLILPACLAQFSSASASFAADVSEADKAAAQALFDEARRLAEQGQYADACPKFARSQELDPGGGTLLNLAACHEKSGKIATAWAEYNEGLSWAIRDGRADRQKFARDHIDALGPRLPRVIVSVVEAQIAGLEVRIDDVPLAPAAWGLPTPMDPGEHSVVALAAGRVESRRTFVVRENDDLKVDIPPLARLPQEIPRQGPETTLAARTAAARATGDGSGSRRTVGFVVGGAGVAALGVGSFFGLRAFAQWSDSNKGCPGGVCTSQGAAAASDAKTSATVSDIAFAAGLLAVGAGLYLILTSHGSVPQAASSRANATKVPALRMAAGTSGIVVDGAW